MSDQPKEIHDKVIRNDKNRSLRIVGFNDGVVSYWLSDNQRMRVVQVDLSPEQVDLLIDFHLMHREEADKEKEGKKHE